MREVAEVEVAVAAAEDVVVSDQVTEFGDVSARELAWKPMLKNTAKIG
jgi:hypothetical protein